MSGQKSEFFLVPEHKKSGPCGPLDSVAVRGEERRSVAWRTALVTGRVEVLGFGFVEQLIEFFTFAGLGGFPRKIRDAWIVYGDLPGENLGC